MQCADLSRKENTAPMVASSGIQRVKQRSILKQKLKLPGTGAGSRRKRLSVGEVSDMLFEFYKTKSAKAPKQQQQQQDQLELSKYGAGAGGQVSPTSAETLEPSSIAAIAVYGAASETASKNLLADEMPQMPQLTLSAAATGAPGAFHPRFKAALGNMPTIKAIPTSVLVANKAAMPTSSGGTTTHLNKPQAAAIAEALVRNGLHSFQQQLRAQEILRHQVSQPHRLHEEHVVQQSGEETTPTKILEKLLRKQQQRQMRNSECENETGSCTEDEDDSRFHAFDDIQLMDQSNGVATVSAAAAAAGDVGLDVNYSLGMFASNSTSSSLKDAKTQAFRNLEFSLSDYGGSSSNGSTISPNGLGMDGEPVYECRHCGKKYRWKSTLRRHENVECGGKEPSHQCPYCPYKSKQRGNLGVHVRKHHTDLPQLPSRRRSKYSMKIEENGAMSISGSLSDDSQGKLIIDCKQVQ